MRGVTRTKRTAVLALAAIAAGCTTTAYQAKFTDPAAPRHVDLAPFIKCHMRDGRLYVLESWHIDVPKDEVTGRGLLYNADRVAQSPVGPQRIALHDVALFETNRPETVVHDGLIALGILTGASVALSAICLSVPKACFGSCPTFYATDGDHDVLQAEGFSGSVARAFEATDVDALWAARPRGRKLEVRMKNEAWETHVVDSVRVLAVQRPEGARVLRAGDEYFPATQLRPPLDCTSAFGSCLEEVEAIDDREYHSPASETDLAERETIDLTFARGQARPMASGTARRGLVVAARNSLLNTFVFYQGLAYMGSRAGEWFAELEAAGPSAERLSGFGSRLGGIDVSVETASGWRDAGEFMEVGPIAREVQLVPLPDDLPSGDVHVRLTLARGNWKLDHVALADLGAPVAPVALDPVDVSRDGHADPAALAKLLAPGAHLVTYPGDAYAIEFELPDGDNELFLESRGYYYEWIRKEWLAEENQREVVRMLFDPAGALRRMAPKYKAVEGRMEGLFWNSRFQGPR